jgi:hypothetical protein
MNQPGPAIDPEIALLARLIIRADPGALRRAAKSLAFKTQRFAADDPRARWRGLDTVARVPEGAVDPQVSRWTGAPKSARSRASDRVLAREAQVRRLDAPLDLERLANDRSESPHRYLLSPERPRSKPHRASAARRKPRRHHHASQQP